MARAIVQEARESQLDLIPVTNFHATPGGGTEGRLLQDYVLVGTVRFLEAHGVESGTGKPVQYFYPDLGEERGAATSLALVAVNGKLAGALVLSDRLKKSTPEAIRELRAEGLRVTMVTGDRREFALKVAKELGIEEAETEVQPQQKSAIITRLRREGRIVGMAGDGINDAPALAAADVGIAMGTGTDVAIENAGITLLKGDLRGIVRALKLSRATIRNIKQNLAFAFLYNVISIPIAAGVFYPIFGWLLSPMLASAAMSFSSVSVIANALRLRKQAL